MGGAAHYPAAKSAGEESAVLLDATIAAALDEDAQIPFPSILRLLAPPPRRTTGEIRA